MEIFTSSDAAVVTNGRGRSSAYKITGSALSQLTSYSAQGALIMINDVTIKDNDIALPVVATDDVRVLFRFGQDFGSLVISGRAYLGAKSCGDMTLLNVIQSAFDGARLSATEKPTQVSVAGSRAYPVYPVALQFSDTQAVTNSVGFSIQCIIAPSKSAGK